MFNLFNQRALNRIVTIPSNGSSLFQWSAFFESYECKAQSQSPQTGQVYFNTLKIKKTDENKEVKSQSPQTGQVYFNDLRDKYKIYKALGGSQSPQTGQVYFNKTKQKSSCKGWIVTIPSNGSSLFQ